MFLLAHFHHSFSLPSLLEYQSTLITMSLGILVAFSVGAIHGLSPGHGKTLVISYLMGTKGTASQALLLGIITTITHTLSILILGLIALFASQYILPEQLYPILSLISGITIFIIGIKLLQSRLQQSDYYNHTHHNHHHHCNNFSSLIGLGLSSGLVPCPSALVLLLSAITLHQISYGLVLVIGFSFGLAFVLIILGLIAVYARTWFDNFRLKDELTQNISIVSAIIISLIGASLTAFSVSNY